jgi:hypothetical protein
MDTGSQTNQIKAALESGRKLTALDALRDFGCFRLAARIMEITDAGYPVDRCMIETEDGKRVAMYWKGKSGD